jgi:LysR family transcriptional activator of nhaA
LKKRRLLANWFSDATGVCLEDNAERLLAQLAMHELDVVLSDVPADRALSVRVFNHLLGECGVTFFGSPPIAKRHRRDFPRSLDGGEFLLPTENTALKRNLDVWFEANGIRPRIRGEFQDNALLDAFGQAGLGLFVGPTTIEREICRQYNVQIIGRTVDVRERVYAISAERKLKHPAVMAISAMARKEFFV